MDLLVVQGLHIGDALLAGALCSSLKRAYPEAKLTFLSRKENLAVLEDHPDIDFLESFPKRKKKENPIIFLFRYLAFVRRMRKKQFSYAFCADYGDRAVSMTLLLSCKKRFALYTKGRDVFWKKWVFDEVCYKRPRVEDHNVQYVLSLLTPLKVPAYPFVLLGSSEERRDLVYRLLLEEGWDGKSKLVQIHPLSRCWAKSWGVEEMAKIITYFTSIDGVQPLLTGGSGEKEQAFGEQIHELSFRCSLNLVGKLTLAELPVLSSFCSLYFGVDSAPMHIAAAASLPVIALFGSSQAFEWGPWPNGYQGKHSPYQNKRVPIQKEGQHLILQDMDAPMKILPNEEKEGKVCTGISLPYDFVQKEVVKHLSEINFL